MQTLVVVFVAILSIIVSLVLIYLLYKTAIYSFSTNIDRNKVKCKKDLYSGYYRKKIFIKGQYYKLNLDSSLPRVEAEDIGWYYFSFSGIGGPLNKLSDYFKV